jgi:hypothetical protein
MNRVKRQQNNLVTTRTTATNTWIGLDRIQHSMRSVIVSTPDYDSLQVIHSHSTTLVSAQGIARQGKARDDSTICHRVYNVDFNNDKRRSSRNVTLCTNHF